ncbi:indolepyruvate oxidoreductase subunit beta [Guggenheimella bovis]
MTTNLLFCGVGGQGLVLATRIVSEAALIQGYDVKTNDVIGLSQRGGKIWGSVRFGEKIHSPNIEAGNADVLVAFEKLEAKRLSHFLKNDGVAIVNDYEMAPSLVQQEKVPYDEDIDEILSKYKEVKKLDATAIAKRLGHPGVANVFMLGVLSNYIPLKEEAFIEAIEKNVPKKFTELNVEAFKKGRNGDY